MVDILAMLGNMAARSALPMLLPIVVLKSEVITTFLALLELIKVKRIGHSPAAVVCGDLHQGKDR